MTPTYTLEDIAERTHLTRADVMRRLRRKVRPWPHRRPNQRDSSTWYFTEADVAAIDDLILQAGPAVDSWGREVRSA